MTKTSTPNSLNLDDIPYVMSKALSILNDELERINSIAVDNRKPTDIKSALACLNTMAIVNKEIRTQDKEIRSEVVMLNPQRTKTLLKDLASS